MYAARVARVIDTTNCSGAVGRCGREADEETRDRSHENEKAQGNRIYLSLLTHLELLRGKNSRVQSPDEKDSLSLKNLN